MDIKPATLVKLLFPLTPLILKTLLLNALKLSANWATQDARTEVTINIIRKISSISKPLSFIQRLSLRDPGIKGGLWISKITTPAPPETDVLDLLLAAIKELGDGTETFTTPSIVPVEAEWTGYRAGVGKQEPRPTLPEVDQYTSLMKETTSPVTILYFHGGAYFLMDPASHRHTTSQLAKLTGGRCLSVRYRLAPQDPFPAQLLDAFISYLYLISPTSDAYHDPVPPSSIVFSGDSAGGNLALTLSLLITTLIRTGQSTLTFHGQTVHLAPPAGVALNSPWTDMTHALPSIHSLAQYDYLLPPGAAPDPPPSPIWPTSPPRAEIFCNATMLTHPLVSPLAAHSDLYTHHPPTILITGYEMLTDSILITARRLATSTTTYTALLAYEGQPHCFALVFPTSPASRHCFRRWADFCLDATSAKLKLSLNTTSATTANLSLAAPKSSAQWMKAHSNPPEFYDVNFDKISALSDEKVDALMAEKKAIAVAKEREEVEAWERGQLKNQMTEMKEKKEQKSGVGSVRNSDEGEAIVESRAKL